MSAGDNYQLVQFASYQGQNVNNIFWYRWVAGSLSGFANGAEALRTGYGSNVLPHIRAVTHTNTIFTGNKTVNYADPFDFEQVGYNLAGQVTGEGLPPYVALSLRSQQPAPGIRRAMKRFGGISENSQVNGLPTAGYLTSIDPLLAALSNPFVSGGVTWQQVLVVDQKNLQLGVNPISYDAVNWVVPAQTGIGRQSSRKF